MTRTKITHYSEVVGPILIMLVIFVAMGCFHVWRSHEEAKAYKRITGKEVSTWDAIFVELRVDSSVKE